VNIEMSKCFGCATVKGSECTTTVSGREIKASSKAKIETSPEQPCTSCTRAVVTCSLGALDAGSYELTYGNRSRVLEIPGRITCAVSGAGGGGGSAP